MATNTEIIKKALQELGVVPYNGSATASQGADMLDILNGMMAEWEQNDIDFGWFPQDTLSDTIPIPRWAENGLISNLAVTGAASFRAPVSDALVLKADRGMNTILTTLINLKLKGSNMDHIHGGGSRLNIRTET